MINHELVANAQRIYQGMFGTQNKPVPRNDSNKDINVYTGNQPGSNIARSPYYEPYTAATNG